MGIDTEAEADSSAANRSVVDNSISFDDDNAECYDNTSVTFWTCDDDKYNKICLL